VILCKIVFLNYFVFWTRNVDASGILEGGCNGLSVPGQMFGYYHKSAVQANLCGWQMSNLFNIPGHATGNLTRLPSEHAQYHSYFSCQACIMASSTCYAYTMIEESAFITENAANRRFNCSKSEKLRR
jgi:hypothetical protein